MRIIQTAIESKAAAITVSFGTITISLSSLMEVINPILALIGTIAALVLTIVLIRRNLAETEKAQLETIYLMQKTSAYKVKSLNVEDISKHRKSDIEVL